MFVDLSEQEIRKVVDPMPPSVLLYQIERVARDWAVLAQFDEARFSVFGKRAQVLLGFTEIGAWVADGPLAPGGSGTGRRFDKTEDCLLLAAKILSEKGLLEEMRKRDPFWYGSALEGAKEKRAWSREAVAA